MLHMLHFHYSQLNNYAFFYGTPLDSASRKIKYDDTVSTINTYHQVGIMPMCPYRYCTYTHDIKMAESE